MQYVFHVLDCTDEMALTNIPKEHHFVSPCRRSERTTSTKSAHVVIQHQSQTKRHRPMTWFQKGNSMTIHPMINNIAKHIVWNDEMCQRTCLCIPVLTAIPHLLTFTHVVLTWGWKEPLVTYLLQNKLYMSWLVWNRKETCHVCSPQFWMDHSVLSLGRLGVVFVFYDSMSPRWIVLEVPSNTMEKLSTVQQQKWIVVSSCCRRDLCNHLQHRNMMNSIYSNPQSISKLHNVDVNIWEQHQMSSHTHFMNLFLLRDLQLYSYQWPHCFCVNLSSTSWNESQFPDMCPIHRPAVDVKCDASPTMMCKSHHVVWICCHVLGVCLNSSTYGVWTTTCAFHTDQRWW